MATDNDTLTWSETKGQEPFNWNKFLDEVPTSDTEHWREAEAMAGSWVTCACGNQCAVIPRREGSTGIPKDMELKYLGYEFMDNIEDRNVASAKHTLALIEQRSAYLLTCPNYTAPDAD